MNDANDDAHKPRKSCSSNGRAAFLVGGVHNDRGSASGWAASSDASATRELSRAACAKWVPLIGREPMPMIANYERTVTEHFIDLYEEGGELLALIEMIPVRDHLLVENIAVRPDQQGKGLGDYLLHHAEGVALVLGLAEVQLYTNAAFLELGLLREARIRGYRRGTMVPGSTTVFMRKCLHGAKSCQ